MPRDPRLSNESDNWLMSRLEKQAMVILREDYDFKPETIGAIRLYDITLIPRISSDLEEHYDYAIPDGNGGFFHIAPNDVKEKQAIDTLRFVKQIRDAIRMQDSYAAYDLAYRFGFSWRLDSYKIFSLLHPLYPDAPKSQKQTRNETLWRQINYWVKENPKVKNAEMARRIRNDPAYSSMVSDIRYLRNLVSRIRRGVA